MTKEPAEIINKIEPIPVEEQLSSYSLKTFGKLKTTVDILFEKKS